MKTAGFTLVEMLIIATIVAILAAIAIPILSRNALVSELRKYAYDNEVVLSDEELSIENLGLYVSNKVSKTILRRTEAILKGPQVEMPESKPMEGVVEVKTISPTSAVFKVKPNASITINSNRIEITSP